MRRSANSHLQLRLDLFDDRQRKDDLLTQDALEWWGGSTLATISEPSSSGVDLGSDRVKVVFHFASDVTPFEVDEVFRWIGSMAGHETDRIVDEWNADLLARAGVPLYRVWGTEHAYSLDDLALCGPPATKEPPVKPAPKPEPPRPPRKRPAPSELPTRRPKTLGGRKINYEIVCLKDHAELRFRSGWGRGPVRFVAKVDLEDVALVSQYAWHVTGSEKRGYAIETDTGAVHGSRIRLHLHRVLLPTWGGQHVRHVNGDWLDFRKANLASGIEARKMQRRNTTGFRGVTFNKKAKKFEAAIGKKRLGLFATAAEAGAVAKAARLAAGWIDRETPKEGCPS